MSDKTRLDDPPAGPKPTRLDPARPGSAATRLDRDAQADNATRLDRDRVVTPGTRLDRDVAVVQGTCLDRDGAAADGPRLDRQPWTTTQPAFNVPAAGQGPLPLALAAEYELVENMAASGAEADLMVVRHRGSGEMVVAKIYRRGIRPKSDVLNRIGVAGNPHLVRLLAHGESDNLYYELMEYCPHGSLRGLVDRGPLPLPQLRSIVEQLAGAVAAAHRVGVIHRDLKPENVLLRRIQPVDVALTDFGIASVQDATQRFTGLARTVHYAAPETLSGVLDAKTDYWSLGIMVLEAAVGRHPFAGLSEAVAILQLTTSKVDLSGLEDATFRNLVRGLLQRNPKKRWGDAEITRWLAGDPDLVAPEDEAPARKLRPYRIEALECSTTGQLGVALARHWEAGKRDLARGLIREWFKSELADQNLVRFHDDLLAETRISEDLRLLRLVAHLAPQLPPVWRGGRVTPEALLARAAQAAQWDEAAGAWLYGLFENRVLEFYGSLGRAEDGRIDREWRAAWSRFCDAWSEAQKKVTHWREQGGVDEAATSAVPVDFDAVVFGSLGFPERPRALRVLGPLLLDVLDGNGFRAFLAEPVAEMMTLLPDCSWLGCLGAPAQLSGADAMALCFLLPEARDEAVRLRKRRAKGNSFNTTIVDELWSETEGALRAIRQIATQRSLDGGARKELGEALQAYHDTTGRVRSRQFTEKRFVTLLVSIDESDRMVQQVEERLGDLEQVVTINRAWRSIPALSFVAGATFMAHRYGNIALAMAILVVAAAIGLWRLLLRRHAARRVHAAGLPIRASIPRAVATTAVRGGTDKTVLAKAAARLADAYRGGTLGRLEGKDWEDTWIRLKQELAQQAPGFSDEEYSLALDAGFRDSR